MNSENAEDHEVSSSFDVNNASIAFGGYSLALAASLLAVTPAWATGSVLSGMFDGSEPVIAPLVESGCTQKPMGVRQSEFEVSVSGVYRLKNAFGHSTSNSPERLGVGVTASVYQGSFDASAPEQNRVVSGVFDSVAGQANLAAGTNYVMVVQQRCWADEGVWVVTFTGPGQVNSDESVAVPSFTWGTVASDAPFMVNPCWGWWDPYESRFQQIGPVQVSQDGLYYFSAAETEGLCLSVFTAPVDPDHSEANYLTSSFWGPIKLKAGQDYYLTVQFSDSPFVGPHEYFYVLAPPAPFRINHGLADSWYNPETPGQGFFLDVFEQLNQVFLGWFTYTDEPNTDDAFAHRWMTASGPFDGTTAKLAIDWTVGGVFDAAQPASEHTRNGTIELEFFDCRTGQVRYAWGGEDSAHPAVSGVIPIERVVNDSVALCESLYRGPGIPGPL